MDEKEKGSDGRKASYLQSVMNKSGLKEGQVVISDGYEIQVRIDFVDMETEKQEFAKNKCEYFYHLARKLMQESKGELMYYKDIAKLIKEEFDKTFEGYWHVIVERLKTFQSQSALNEISDFSSGGYTDIRNAYIHRQDFLLSSGISSSDDDSNNYHSYYQNNYRKSNFNENNNNLMNSGSQKKKRYGYGAQKSHFQKSNLIEYYNNSLNSLEGVTVYSNGEVLYSNSDTLSQLSLNHRNSSNSSTNSSPSVQSSHSQKFASAIFQQIPQDKDIPLPNFI